MTLIEKIADLRSRVILLEDIFLHSTVIIIPHDINQDPVVVDGGMANQRKFDSIHLREAISEAERRRLDNEFKRTTERLKAAVLPEEL